MGTYHQLTEYQRYQIYALKKAGHGQKKRKKRYGKADGRGQIKDRVSMDQRPAIVEAKSRIGDWEIDLVMGRPRPGALVSVVERRSRYTVLGKVPSKQAEHVAAATIELLTPHREYTQTITADNGKELAVQSLTRLFKPLACT